MLCAFQPEMRLLAMIPYVIIMYIGNIVASVGMERKWPWQVIVVIAYGAAGMQVASIPSIVSTYAVDSYKPVAGPLFVAITVNKNVWGYGFSKFITPWIDQVSKNLQKYVSTKLTYSKPKAGYIPPIMTNGTLVLLWCLFGILFYYKGKTFRRWSVFPPSPLFSHSFWLFPSFLDPLALSPSANHLANIYCSIGLATLLCIECRLEDNFVRFKTRAAGMAGLHRLLETLYIHICTEICSYHYTD
jgi:hypothetical protein